MFCGRVWVRQNKISQFNVLTKSTDPEKKKKKKKIFFFSLEKAKPNQTRFSFSASRLPSLLQTGCYSPGSWPRLDSAALGERKKPNQTNKKTPPLPHESSLRLQPARTSHSAARTAQERLGQFMGTAHTAQSPQLPGGSRAFARAGRVQRGQSRLSPLRPGFSLELMLPGTLRSS